MDIEVRRFINELMNRTEEELFKIFGEEIVRKYKLNEKKVFAKLLAEWKKEYLKKKNRSIEHVLMLEDVKKKIGFVCI